MFCNPPCWFGLDLSAVILEWQEILTRTVQVVGKIDRDAKKCREGS